MTIGERSAAKMRIAVPQPGELQALHLKPKPQCVPPAIIGASVGVVTNSTGQNDRARRQLRPPVRPGGAGDIQQRGVEPIDRIPPMSDRRPGMGELLRESDRRWDGNDGLARPLAASASAWPSSSGSANVGCAVNTAAKRGRSTSARYSAQRTGESFGSGRSRVPARRARIASLAVSSMPPTYSARRRARPMNAASRKCRISAA